MMIIVSVTKQNHVQFTQKLSKQQQTKIIMIKFRKRIYKNKEKLLRKNKQHDKNVVCISRRKGKKTEEPNINKKNKT